MEALTRMTSIPTIRPNAVTLRILYGANDIEPLKELAERYRGILRALGIEEPSSGVSPTP